MRRRDLYAPLRQEAPVRHLLHVNSVGMSMVLAAVTMLQLMAAGKSEHSTVLILRASFVAISLGLVIGCRAADESPKERLATRILTAVYVILAYYRTWAEPAAHTFWAGDSSSNDVSTFARRDYWVIPIIWFFTGVPLTALVLATFGCFIGIAIDILSCYLRSSRPPWSELIFFPVYCVCGILVYYAVVCMAASACRVYQKPLRALLDLPIEFFTSTEAEALNALPPRILGRETKWTRDEHLLILLRVAQRNYRYPLLLLIADDDSIIEKQLSTDDIVARREFRNVLLLHHLHQCPTPAVRKLAVELGYCIHYVSPELSTRKASLLKSQGTMLGRTFAYGDDSTDASDDDKNGRRSTNVSNMRRSIIIDNNGKGVNEWSCSRPPDIPNFMAPAVKDFLQLQETIMEGNRHSIALSIAALPPGVLLESNKPAVEAAAVFNNLPTFTGGHSGGSSINSSAITSTLSNNHKQQFYRRRPSWLEARGLRPRVSLAELIEKKVNELNGVLKGRKSSLMSIKADFVGNLSAEYCTWLPKFIKKFLAWLTRITVAMEAAQWRSKVVIPRLTMLSTFTDWKLERWYLSWAAAGKGRIHVMLARPLLAYQILYCATVILYFSVGPWDDNPSNSGGISWFKWGYLATRAGLHVFLASAICLLQSADSLDGPLNAHYYHRRAVVLAFGILLLCHADEVVQLILYKTPNYHLLLIAVTPLPFVLQLGPRMSLLFATTSIFILLATVVPVLVLYHPAGFFECFLYIPTAFLWIIGTGIAADGAYRLLFSRYVLPYLLYTDALQGRASYPERQVGR